MKVRDLFHLYAGAHVSVLPNYGNCGDGLIAMGLRQLAGDHAVSFTELLYPRPAKGHALFALGCGNLCRQFHFQVAKIQSYLDSFQRVYLLPCSIDPECGEVAQMLAALPSHVTIFCREPYSMEKVRPLVAGRVAVHLDHDLGFAVDFQPWMKKGAGRLNAFRTDGESNGFTPPPDNIDISLWGGSDDGEILLRTVSDYQVIHTDRAHVAICAAMLGKETHVYPNNYHKVRGIYEYSLRGKANVVFHDGSPAWTGA